MSVRDARAMPRFDLKAFFNQPLATSARANLSPSFVEPLSTATLLELEPDAAEELARQPLGYTATFGGAALRQAIAGRYAGVEPDDVIATSGADDALASLFMALLQPGDRVVVQHPVYQPLVSVAGWCGADVVAWPAREEHSWQPSLDELALLLRPRTSMLVVNLPHSPTGFMADADWLRQLAALASDLGVLLVSDEIYRGLPLDGTVEPPSMADLSEDAVALSGVSKTLGLPGLRVGWLASRNRDVLDAVRAFRLHQNTYLGAPVELLATVALRHADTLLARNRELGRTNLTLLHAFLARHPDWFSCVVPRTGVVAYPRWLGGEATTELSERLLRDYQLLLAPSAYFAGGERHVRLGFGIATFERGLELLETALQPPGTS